MTAAPGAYPKPSFVDWLVLAISVIFVIAGLVILRRDLNTGIVSVTFFGLCAVAHGPPSSENCSSAGCIRFR